MGLFKLSGLNESDTLLSNFDRPYSVNIAPTLHVYANIQIFSIGFFQFYESKDF